jgi:hypothetical protein
MAEVRIRIVSESDLAGITSTQQAMEKLDRTTGKTAASSAEFFKQQDILRQNSTDTAQALSDMTHEAKALGGAVDKTTESKSRLLAGMKKLGHEVPVLGAAFNVLKNSWTGLAFLAANFVREVLSQIKVQDDLAASSASLAAALDPVVLKTARHKTEASAAAIATQQHADALDAAAQAANDLDAALSKNLGAIERELRVEQARLNLDKQRALRGVTDPTRRAEIDLQFEERARALTDKAEDRKAQQIAHADFLQRQQSANAEQLLPGARKELERRKSVAAQFEKESGAVTPDMAALQKELAEAMNAPNFWERVQWGMTLGLMGRTPKEGARSVEDIQADIQSGQQTLDHFKSRSLSRQSDVDRQQRFVQSLETIGGQAGRFAPSLQTALGEQGARRTIAGLQTAAGREQFAGDSEIAQARRDLEAAREREKAWKALVTETLGAAATRQLETEHKLESVAAKLRVNAGR